MVALYLGLHLVWDHVAARTQSAVVPVIRANQVHLKCSWLEQAVLYSEVSAASCIVSSMPMT